MVAIILLNESYKMYHSLPLSSCTIKCFRKFGYGFYSIRRFGVGAADLLGQIGDWERKVVAVALLH